MPLLAPFLRVNSCFSRPSGWFVFWGGRGKILPSKVCEKMLTTESEKSSRLAGVKMGGKKRAFTFVDMLGRRVFREE